MTPCTCGRLQLLDEQGKPLTLFGLPVYLDDTLPKIDVTFGPPEAIGNPSHPFWKQGNNDPL